VHLREHSADADVDPLERQLLVDAIAVETVAVGTGTGTEIKTAATVPRTEIKTAAMSAAAALLADLPTARPNNAAVRTNNAAARANNAAARTEARGAFCFFAAVLNGLC
jgi:hypothetical protein